MCVERKEFDEESLARLADSLKSRGQLQPIRVRWDDAADRYIVVVGERRYRAAILAGMEAVACVVVSGNPTLEDLLNGRVKGRTSPEQITFSERGNIQGAQFFAVAGAVYEAASARSFGRVLPTEWFLQDIRD